MDYRASGLGPYYDPSKYGRRAAGLGPFVDRASSSAGAKWLAQNSGGRSWRSRRRRGGWNFKKFAKKAWAGFKSTFLPIAQQKGKEFLKHAAKHAIEKGPDYYREFKKDGVSGVKSMFLDNASGLATDFVRNLTNRGSGPACDALTTVIQSARPEISKLLSSDPVAARGEHYDIAHSSFLQQKGRCNHDLVAVAPLQVAYDMVLGSCGAHMTKEEKERGGFPFALLIPLIAAAISAVPRVIDAVKQNPRGSGDLQFYTSMFKPNEPFPIPQTALGHSVAGKRNCRGGFAGIGTWLSKKIGSGCNFPGVLENGQVPVKIRPGKGDDPTCTNEITLVLKKHQRGRPSSKTYWADSNVLYLFE
ncbi:TPA_asm: LO6 [Tilapia adomavirus 1]|uniref:LO6 n=1 Tax=Tilapia adomavirus 1 TaxID=2597803 RepID=A0A5H3CKU3_9VIRU|nr:TPA_asm: LO6 [Tilapia adomavirus 1]